MPSRDYTVAILGATGAVGTRLMEQLAQSKIPLKQVKFLASARSAGKKLKFSDQTFIVEEARPEVFENVDLVLASAGGSVSKQLLPEAVKRGAVCVDNTSAFRMDPQVPLVVPEVNAQQLKYHHGIIANPNCSTIQMVVALEPLRQRFGLQQVVVSTYQAVSGAGRRAWQELLDETQAQLDNQAYTPEILPTASDAQHYPIAFNLLPQIDVFETDGYSHEEWKMIHETKKIMLNDMDSQSIKVTATCVRVPVVIGHGEAVYFQLADHTATVAQLQAILKQAPGITLQDNPQHQIYPQPIQAAGSRQTFVGRVRADAENPGAFHMWVVSDNLLKGAAWNTVQIAEELVKQDLVRVP